MKILRRILGIPLAFAILLGILTVLIYIPGLDHYFAYHFNQNLAYHFTTLLILFFILILLSCIFIPQPKKWGAVISSAICYLLALVALYYQLFVLHENINPILISSLSGVFAGLIIGTYTCFEIFKYKGWSSLKNDTL